MSDMSTKNYLKVAVAAAKDSGKIFKQFFGKPNNIKMKNDNPRDLVTEIDTQIESKIRKRIFKHFPKHKIIGEEFGSHKINPNDLIWIIDPIDGTHNYIQGLPFCCISIALWDKSGPLAAALYNPVLNQLFTAERGKGAKLNNKPIKVSKKNQLIRAFGAVGWIDVEKGLKLFSTMAEHCKKLRVLASSAVQICLVGSGNLDFYIAKNIKIWDFAAGILVAKEAGGIITDLGGKKIGLDTKNVVASNPHLHKQLVSVLKTIR